MGVDLILARNAHRREAVAVIIVIEELLGIWIGRMSDVFDPMQSRTREGFTGRTIKVIGIDRFLHKTITISLKPKRKRAITTA